MNGVQNAHTRTHRIAQTIIEACMVRELCLIVRVYGKEEN